ncbi:Peroxidase, family 2-domain-containing protein [Mycena filopes]|nr:Peroxidase, family 2-domain-containing protein [Mycena filopes]
MHSSSTSSFKLVAIALTLVAPSLAFPAMIPRPADVSTRATLAVGDWAAPGPNDIRGPCPGLNTLSNHGFLPRDGRNIRAIDIITAMDANLGVKADFGFLQTIVAGFRGAFVFLPDFSVGLESFDALTNSHNSIEHDASFTRNDAFFDIVASGVDPNFIDNDALPTVHNPVLNVTQIEFLLGFSKDGQKLTIDDIADARHERLRQTVALNPTATIEKKQTDAMWREGALISLVVGDADGAVRVDWLREWFVTQRLPTALGWQKRSPSAGLIENIKLTNTYLNAEKVRNGNDVAGRTPELPIEFGLL